MPYREIYLGDGESTIARVSQEAVDEWLEVRERNKRLGYPDRPPDVDTELMRSWVVGPHDPEYEHLVKNKNAARDSNSFPIYSLATDCGGYMEAKFLVGWSDKKGYSYRLLSRTPSGSTLSDQEWFSEEWDEEAFLSSLALFANLFIMGSDEYMVTTYNDFVAMSEEINLAEKELQEYYERIN